MAKSPKFPKLIYSDGASLAGSQLLAQFFAARQLDSEVLGCRYLTPIEVNKFLGYAIHRGGIHIPYHSADSMTPLIESSGDNVYRIRLLPYGDKKGKYRSARGSKSHAYLTPGLDWNEIGADASIPVMLTEGEFKAAKVCLTDEWPACVGFAGVNSWGGIGQGVKLVEEIMGWEWKGRKVYICFDSDITTKVEVQRAQSQLVGAMHVLGAETMILHLARTGATEAKGVDDYIVDGGSWMALLATAEAGEASELTKMLGQYAVMDKLKDGVIDLDTGHIYNIKWFHTLSLPIKMIGGTTEKPKPIVVSQVWASHPRRIKLDGPTLIPGEAWGIIGSQFNMWKGYKHPPVKGDMYEGVVEHWEHTCETVFGELAGLWHRWNAWWIQNPDIRNYTSWIIKSHHEGVGKSLVGELIARMVGDRVGEAAKVVGPDDLFSNFPTYAEGPVFLVCNEIASDSNRHRNGMKSLRTNDTLRVERKGVQPYVVNNYLNLVVSTNDDFAFGMSQDSRRDIVVEACEGISDWKGWRLFLNDVVAPMMRDPVALSCLMYYYTNLGLDGYDPRADAPHTDARVEMSRASDGGNAVMRELAEEIVMRWGGKGVIVSSVLRKFLENEPFVKNDGKWVIFLRYIGKVAGAKATGNEGNVKIEGVTKACIIFGKDRGVVENIQRQVEIKRSLEIMIEWLKER